MPFPTSPSAFRMYLRLLAAALLAVAAGLTAGCQGYHQNVISGIAGKDQGPLMHEQIRTVGIGDFRNETEDATLTAHLRQKLADYFMNDGSLSVRDRKDADVIVQGRVLNTTSKGIGFNRRSQSVRDQNNRDSYQTTSYEISVTIEYEVRMPGLRRPVLEARRVIGVAPYSSLQDFNVARDEAAHRAVQDAAQKIVAEITEAW